MKRSLLTLVVSVALLGTAGAAHAGTEVGQWTVGIGGLYTIVDSDRGYFYPTPGGEVHVGLDDGAAINISGGYAMSEKWDVAFNVFAGNHDRIGGKGESTIKG